MGNDHWKKVEAGVMKKLGGERTGTKGYGRPVEDGHAGKFSVEVKHRKDTPKWLTDAVKQAEKNAPAGSLPIVVIHPKYARYSKSLVVVRLEQFQEWFGEVHQDEVEVGEDV